MSASSSGPRAVTITVVDSPTLADMRRAELDIRPSTARARAFETLEAIEVGSYTGPNGQPVDFKGLQATAVAERVSIPADGTLPSLEAHPPRATNVLIANETTSAAAHALVRGGLRTLALNFANGVEPGGGFLYGARAQEESLCRQSGLYATLVGDPMYALHRAQGEYESSDAAILSPQVPFFRDDRGEWLATPWLLDVLTCAAPVATQVGQPRSAQLLRTRIHRVLAIAQAFRFPAIVLGAWGCGAFGNDPAQTATDFADALSGPFAGVFSHVHFAISDWSSERRFIAPFREVLSERFG
jgi:uncharacterized protein (TIGR02452 family)